MRTLLSFLLLLLSVTAAQAGTYELTDLGDLGGSGVTMGYAVNDAGHVTGLSSSPTGDRAFLWKPGTGIADLGAVSSGGITAGVALNAQSDVVGAGAGVDSGGNYVDWKSFIVRSGLPMDTFTWSGGDAFANDIADDGRIVGFGIASDDRWHALLWDDWTDLTPLDLPILPDRDMSMANAINSTGQVVGESNNLTGPNRPRAFVWDAVTGLTPLGAFTSDPAKSNAVDITDSGLIAGYSWDAAENFRAVLWTAPGVFTDLGTLPGHVKSAAKALNEHGVVVGSSGAGNTAAFVWDSTNKMRNLNDLVGASGLGWSLLDAQGVNNHGQITGYGFDPQGRLRGFLLTPSVPLPPAAWLGFGLLGALALSRIRRRK